MKLLIATDHRFFRHQSGVYDDFCFDRSFFDDYRRIFASVEVLCRMARVDSLPAGSRRSDGEGVQFVDVPDIHGAAWLLRAGRLSGPNLKPAVERADAVVARVPSELGWLAARRAQRLEKPSMIEVIGDPLEAILSIGRGPIYRFIAWLQARRLRRLAQQAEAGSYVSRYLGRVYGTPPGIPQEAISSIRLQAGEIKLPRDFSHPSPPLKIVQVATMTPRKRYQDLIKACRQVLDQGVAVEIHFAGDGACRPELETLSQALNVGDHIIFHGHIANRQTLNNLLDSSDLFVLTSASEGLPRAILEAMARGLPAAATRIPGVDELVSEAELFPVGDTSALATLIIALSRDPDRLTALSRYSIETAKQYTHAVLSPRRLKLYRVLREQASRSRFVLAQGQADYKEKQ